MKKYNMIVDALRKKFNVMVEGRFNEEDATSFINEYNDKTGKIQASTYDIVLDCTNLQVVTPEILPMLEQCYKLYKETGFRKVVFEVKENPTLKMQLGRIARRTELHNYEVVDVEK